MMQPGRAPRPAADRTKVNKSQLQGRDRVAAGAVVVKHQDRDVSARCADQRYRSDSSILAVDRGSSLALKCLHRSGTWRQCWPWLSQTAMGPTMWNSMP